MLLTQDFIKWLRDPEVLLSHFLGTYGVWIVAFVVLIVFIEPGVLFPVLPSDSMLFAVGLLQNRIPMSLAIIYLVVITAAICGGQMDYWLGLLFGEKSFKDDMKILKTEYLKFPKVFSSKWGGSAVVLGRFIPFIRTFVSVATGIGRYHQSRFTLWNVAGAIAWTPTFVVAEVLPGDVPLVRDSVGATTIIIIVFSALLIAVGPVKKHLDARRCATKPYNVAWFSTACGRWFCSATQVRYSD